MIRPATIYDAPAIVAIYNRYIAETAVTFETVTIETAEMERRISEILATGPFLVYCDGDCIKGYCYAHPWKERAAYSATFEVSVYLAPENCGQGIGTMLLNRLIADCRSRGVHVLVACITGGNTVSNRLHEKAGFNKVSCFKEVGRKFDRWYDVVDYELIL